MAVAAIARIAGTVRANLVIADSTLAAWQEVVIQCQAQLPLPGKWWARQAIRLRMLVLISGLDCGLIFSGMAAAGRRPDFRQMVGPPGLEPGTKGL